MSNRHLARTLAMQTLFMWDFNGQQKNNLLDIINKVFKCFAPDFNDEGFVKKLIKGVTKNLSKIDKYIIK